MDLLQTVRKEGSRGGVNFSWDDVKSSQHRENYLGHSLMAPVGRWQKNKDLNWYAKADDEELTPEQRLEKERERKREEMRKIKEAEEDAMAKALGLPVPDRTNANNEPLGMSKEKQKEVNQALKETFDDHDHVDEENGVGYGGFGGANGDSGKEIMKGSRSKEERRRKERSRNQGRGRGQEIDTGIGETDIDMVSVQDRGRERDDKDPDREVEIEDGMMRWKEGDDESTMIGLLIERGIADDRKAGADHARRTRGHITVMSIETYS